MTGGIAKVVIFSFTERGTKQNRYIYRKLKMQGYICEGYAGSVQRNCIIYRNG